MSRWIWEFRARSPNAPENEFWTIGIQEQKFRFLQRKGDIVRLSRLALVEDTVEDTVMIIQGWSRPDKEDCLVYVGTPRRDFRGPEIETPPPKNTFFLVFVLPDGTIDHWTWRRADENDPSKPEGTDGDVIWPIT